jgi:hypothetical protein
MRDFKYIRFVAGLQTVHMKQGVHPQIPHLFAETPVRTANFATVTKYIITQAAKRYFVLTNYVMVPTAYMYLQIT